MQRKNNLLIKSSRNAFAIMAAVGVLVILAVIMAFSIQMNTKSTKEVVDTYVKNQAELYAKNAAEYALFQIAKAHTPCIPNKIDPFTIDDIYDVNIDLAYAYALEDDDNSSCSDANLTYVNLLNASSADREYGYVKIDVAVEVKEEKNVTSEPIRIFRRYLEDITPYIK